MHVSTWQYEDTELTGQLVAKTHLSVLPTKALVLLATRAQLTSRKTLQGGGTGWQLQG